jgi:hypothetical protein
MLKVYVFEKDFLTDWTHGLGVVFAHNKKEAIEKMAYLVWGDSDYIQDFSMAGITEYTVDNFPGVFIHGGA